MSLRPVPARWFEVLVARDDLSKAATALAQTGRVELENRDETAQLPHLAEMLSQLDRYHTLAQHYQNYWPRDELTITDTPQEPDKRLERAIARLTAWRTDSDPLILKLEALQSRLADLNLLELWLNHLEKLDLDLGLLAHAGPNLTTRLFVLPDSNKIEHLPPSILSHQISSDTRAFLLAAGTVEDIRELQSELSHSKARIIVPPEWLQGTNVQAQNDVARHRQITSHNVDRLEDQLQELATQHELRHVLGDINHLEWFLAHIKELPVTDNLGWISGWTSDDSGKRLNKALADNHVRAVTNFPDPPPDRKPPLIMKNRRWIKPFELFAGLLGTPDAAEADPAPLLAVIVPLLFGYMFGDIGHGFILLSIGWLLRKRIPGQYRLLMVCGASAMAFGLVFGSIFGNEHLIDPLWVRPLEHPLLVLMVPMVAGVIILLLGLTLNSIAAWWRRETDRWLLTEAPVVVMYVAILASLFNRSFLLLLAAGFIWYLAGSLAMSANNKPAALLKALGELIETLLQLIINTISFIRVGAFALAHGGLSLAFIIMAESIDNIVARTLILILGNIIVILLEGLVVSIQTTRLVLFEFFIRFLRATGRVFHPLEAPDEKSTQTRRTS